MMKPVWFTLLLILGFAVNFTLAKPRNDKNDSIVNHQNVSNNRTLELIDISCNTVTAYFNGTLQRQNNASLQVNVQFQIRMQVSNGDIFFQIQNWNNDYLNSTETLFFIYLSGNVYRCYFNQPCYVDLPAKAADFYIKIWGHNNEWFGQSVLRFPSFLNTFVLKQAAGQCTNYQETTSDFPNQNLYQFCACCGEYNPDPATNCPKSPWQKKTPCPTKS
ncbi:hypothetical protein M3Y97_00947700 [Aphelenchoides bicaudatus]|nr:hypothetical protein M3Y97_00947700 [Aphelenchoides bicaudatus]